MKELKKDGYKIWSVELDDNSVDYTQLFDLKEEKVCLVMGNEVAGVSSEMMKLSDKIVSIPMR